MNKTMKVLFGITVVSTLLIYYGYDLFVKFLPGIWSIIAIFVIISIVVIVSWQMAYSDNQEPAELDEETVYMFAGAVTLNNGKVSEEFVYLYETSEFIPMEKTPQIYRVKKNQDNARVNNHNFLKLGSLYKPKLVQFGYINWGEKSFGLELQPYVKPQPEMETEHERRGMRLV